MELTILTDYPTLYFRRALDAVSKDIEIKLYSLFSGSSVRQSDFYASPQRIISLNNSLKSEASLLSRLRNLFNFRKQAGEHVCICGWDFLEYWAIALFMKPKMLVMNLESTIVESKITGFAGFLKRIFVSRIDVMIVPGLRQKELALALGFKGQILITGGVGYHNWFEETKPNRDLPVQVKNLLYVGRLSEEKGVFKIIEVSKLLPDLNFVIVGNGPLEAKIHDQINSEGIKNIKMMGYVDNKNLAPYYLENDIFILPSDSEVWGLVVEEALHFGMPVIVSDKVGCADDLVLKYSVGKVFHSDEINSLKLNIELLSEPDVYKSTVKNITEITFYNDVSFTVAIENLAHIK